MRPTTTRRTLVFAVCIAGVVALYWVPTAVRTPERVGVSASPHGAPTVPSVDATGDPIGWPTTVVSSARPAPTGTVEAPSSERPPTAVEPSTDGATEVARPTRAPSETSRETDGGAGTGGEEGTDEDPAPDVPSASTRPGTPVQPPSDGATERPRASRPGTVRGLHLVTSDYRELTVGWDADDAAIGYVVELNGYRVAGTTGTEAALRWFNDDMSEHYVEVRAVGDDGRLSRQPAHLRVQRPASPPVQTPSASPTPPTDDGGEPTGDPTGAAAPTPGPTSGPTATR